MLASQPEIINKLFELSQGEPLLLRLYVDDLWKRKEEIGRLTVEDLAKIKPGLGGYFKDWMRRQREAWQQERKQGAQIQEETLNAYLAVLACAYGPLTADELGELVRRAHGLSLGLRVEDALDPLRRFVIGAGKSQSGEADGYVLTHPRFADFIREEYLDRTPIERTWQAFVKWGRNILGELKQGALAPSRVPSYLLHSLTERFVDAEAPSTDFMALVELTWKGFERSLRKTDPRVRQYVLGKHGVCLFKVQ